MSKKLDAIPYLLLIAGLLGLMLIVAASRNDVYPWGAAGPSSSDPVGTTIGLDESPTPTSGVTRSLEATPTRVGGAATPSATTPTAGPSATVTPSPTPTPSLAAISPPALNASGAMAYVDRGVLTVVEANVPTVTTVGTGVSDDPQVLLWSPDGQRLLYGTWGRDASTGSGREALRFQIWDSQTGETIRLPQEASGFRPTVSDVRKVAWSPESRRILFRFATNASSPGGWVFDVPSTQLWPLPDPVSGALNWLDEDTVLYVDQGARAAGLVAVGPSAQILTSTLSINQPYALSPDRGHAASFTGQPGKGRRLQVNPLPGQDPLALSRQPTVTVSGPSPLWSPDSRWIAYGAKAIVSRQAEGPHTLLADTEGMIDTQIFPAMRPVAWSPDSRFLAGFGCSEVACSLSLVDTTSGYVTNVASGESLRLWGLAWSPRGVYLAYSMTGPDAHTDGLVLWDRGTYEHLPLIEGNETEPFTDLGWTPDGCTLYAARRQATRDLAVSAVWGVGPDWVNHWQLAPGFSDDPASLVDALERTAAAPRTALCRGSLLEGRRLVAYYGTPLGPGLGILGRYGMTETLNLLEEQAQAYRELAPEVDTIPTFHMVTTIADDFPGRDGDFNHRVPHETIRRWIEMIGAAGGWSVVDIQPGRATLSEELDAVEPLLLLPRVHLAVDPEFIVNDEQVPGRDLGQITGPQINWIQARLDQLARETGQRKMLVIHQFDDRMVAEKGSILDYPLVDLVWDADGFGGPGPKIGDYNRYKTEPGFEFGGFKLFYRYDKPVMTPEEVLSLSPPPRLVIYQ